ncbi:MAG: hypothetical protein RL226_489 [Bacteroidota bacterium]
MYKVFISDRPVTFQRIEGKIVNPSEGELILTFKDSSDLTSLYAVLEGRKEIQRVTLLVDDEAQAFEHFCQMHVVIVAAGGIVENDRGEILMIHRLGKWDLPKGKVDEGETIEDAAVREVVEECGIPEPTNDGFFATTYHCYDYKGNKALKPSHWFSMHVAGAPKLTPQFEENITEARWVAVSEIESLLPESYPSIAEVLKAYIRS